MKTIKTLSVLLLGGIALNSTAQIVTVKIKDADPIVYDASKVEYIQFTDEDYEDLTNLLTEQYIPDPTFRNWINEHLANNSGYYSFEDAIAYTGTIDLAEKIDLESLEGLSYFPNITGLNVQGCQKLDNSTLPHLDALTYFNCVNSSRSTFDALALFPNLERLLIGSNNFEGSMVISSDKLKEFDCFYNPGVTSVDVSGCPNLQTLTCTNCNIQSVELGNAPIEYLYCYGNPALTSINIDNIRPILKEYTISGTGLHDVDVSGCVSLEYLEFQDGLFYGKIDLTGCEKLETLRCQNSYVQGELDLTTLKNLKVLYCFNNQISGLNLAGLSKLEWVYGYNNYLDYINLEGCVSATALYLYNNYMPRIDISDCLPENLTAFDCEDNYGLTEIKVWPTFDLNNPPVGFLKPMDAKYVYEFSE